jgi:hypothetical protein
VTLPRTVAPEVLDHLAPEHPAARRSRRDLVRVHRAMGTRSIVVHGWRQLVSPPRGGAPLRILELGAGDGSLLLGVARSLAPSWPPVQLSLLDRQDLVSPATLAGFAALGWPATVQVRDILDWAQRPDDAAPALRSPRWDLITTSLFLHHFEGPELDHLLAAACARCDRFFACEPSRSWRALAGSHLVGAIGANAVTREDAVLSVHAGFRRDEISVRWPGAGGPWQVREGAAGLFSHCFSARRSGSVA